MSKKNFRDVISTSRIVVCCGSGGVGKTTTAAALAMQAAEIGRRVVLITIDPAKRLAMGNAGKEKVRQQFMLTNMVERYIRLYNKLISP